MDFLRSEVVMVVRRIINLDLETRVGVCTFRHCRFDKLKGFMPVRK